MTKKEWLLKEGYYPFTTKSYIVPTFRGWKQIDITVPGGDYEFYKYFLVEGTYYKIFMDIREDPRDPAPKHSNNVEWIFYKKHNKYLHYEDDKLELKEKMKIKCLLDKIGREEWIKLIRGANGIPSNLEKEER